MHWYQGTRKFLTLLVAVGSLFACVARGPVSVVYHRVLFKHHSTRRSCGSALPIVAGKWSAMRRARQVTRPGSRDRRAGRLGRPSARRATEFAARNAPVAAHRNRTYPANSRASPHRQLTTEFEFDHDSTSFVLSCNLRLSFVDQKSYRIMGFLIDTNNAALTKRRSRKSRSE
jgi:hypothetical protein